MFYWKLVFMTTLINTTAFGWPEGMWGTIQHFQQRRCCLRTTRQGTQNIKSPVSVIALVFITFQTPVCVSKQQWCFILQIRVAPAGVRGFYTHIHPTSKFCCIIVGRSKSRWSDNLRNVDGRKYIPQAEDWAKLVLFGGYLCPSDDYDMLMLMTQHSSR